MQSEDLYQNECKLSSPFFSCGDCSSPHYTENSYGLLKKTQPKFHTNSKINLNLMNKDSTPISKKESKEKISVSSKRKSIQSNKQNKQLSKNKQNLKIKENQLNEHPLHQRKTIYIKVRQKPSIQAISDEYFNMIPPNLQTNRIYLQTRVNPNQRFINKAHRKQSTDTIIERLNCPFNSNFENHRLNNHHITNHQQNMQFGHSNHIHKHQQLNQKELQPVPSHPTNINIQAETSVVFNMKMPLQQNQQPSFVTFQKIGGESSDRNHPKIKPKHLGDDLPTLRTYFDSQLSHGYTNRSDFI